MPAPSRGHKHERDWRHVQLKQQRIGREREGSDELEVERTFELSFATGTDAGDNPRSEDEREGDDLLDDESPTVAFGDESDINQSWTRRRLLGSRPAVVIVRLIADGDHAVPKLLIEPRTDSSRRMLGNLCDFLRDRFGPAGREAFTFDEWEALLGTRAVSPTERLVLLSRLSVAGNHGFAHDSGTATPSDLGLEHYSRKFAALPDGTAFSIGLLLAGGKTGQKRRADSQADHPFDRLAIGVRLLALARALRAEAADGWIRKDIDFRVLLRNEAATLLGTTMPALPERSVSRLRELLKRHGLERLFPNAPARKRAFSQIAPEVE